MVAQMSSEPAAAFTHQSRRGSRSLRLVRSDAAGLRRRPGGHHGLVREKVCITLDIQAFLQP